MPKITIEDEILAPSNKMVLAFKGKNPFIVCKVMRGILLDVLKISTKDIYEKVVRWDVTTDPRGFYLRMFANHEEDRWTDTRFKITVYGAQSPADKTGWVKIVLEGRVITDFEYANFLQRALWFLYERMFYYKQRRAYLEQAKQFIMDIRKELLSALKILTPIEGVEGERYWRSPGW